MRLNIGSGGVRYSNSINLDLEKHPNVDIDIEGDVRKGLSFKDETFKEVLLIHVIEHIERKYHNKVLDEIWRVLKPNGRLIMGFPDFIECAKRFIENRNGGRWSFYHDTIFGQQTRKGDYHVTAIERQNITDKLISCGFVDIKYLQQEINVTLTARKGEKLKEYL